MPRYEPRYQVPRQSCPSCRHALELARAPLGDDVAVPGNLAICGHCRAWLMFTETMGFRAAEPAEIDLARKNLPFEMAMAEVEADKMIRERRELRRLLKLVKGLERAGRYRR